MSQLLFNSLELCPDDPILQLMVNARNDANPQKVDLSAGIYKNEQGQTPILECVKIAEHNRLQGEDTKAYLGLAGDLRFNHLMTELVLGDKHPRLADKQVSAVQTTGGSGAIRLAAELIKRADADTRVWVSDPTWANHIPLLQAAGLSLSTYAYYQANQPGVRFEQMMQDLRSAKAGDVILLQGSCHNPSGEDLSFAQWQELTKFVLDKGIMPFVDIAYHGLSQDLDQDSAGWRYMASAVPEMLISYSGSKNFSLYRDRVGVLMSIAPSSQSAQKLLTNMTNISRVLYSLPPAHGAFLVAEILDKEELRSLWLSELSQMRTRINQMRTGLADALAQRLENYTDQASDRFDFIRHQQGMFSFLGITAEQVLAMREKHSIYLLNSSRVNIAGVSNSNIDYLADAIVAVL